MKSIDKTFIIKYSIIFFVMIFTSDLYCKSLDIRFEAGGVRAPKNNIKIDGITGTSLDQSITDFNFYYRVYLSYFLSEKSELRLLYAPLSYVKKYLKSTPIIFYGTTFQANDQATLSYKFNSYRLSYIYNLFKSGNYKLNIGFTNKIRDAKTQLKNSIEDVSYSNVGYVPLFHISSSLILTNSLSLDFDSDFSWAPQGRAWDLMLSFNYKISNLGFEIGYRFLEGGAANDKVYNFAGIEYIFGGFSINF